MVTPHACPCPCNPLRNIPNSREPARSDRVTRIEGRTLDGRAQIAERENIHDLSGYSESSVRHAMCLRTVLPRGSIVFFSIRPREQCAAAVL
jgi:hypothetical protein